MSWISKVKAAAAFAEQKASEFDAKHGVSGKARALSASAQEKWKEVDEKHNVSAQVGAVAAKAQGVAVGVAAKINEIDQQHQVSAKVQAGASKVNEKVGAFAAKHQIQERVQGAVTSLDEKLGVTDDGYRAKMVKKLGQKGLEEKEAGAGAAIGVEDHEAVMNLSVRHLKELLTYNEVDMTGVTEKPELQAMVVAYSTDKEVAAVVAGRLGSDARSEAKQIDEEQPKTPSKEVAECPICLECIVAGTCDPIVCGHQFHQSCLDEWLQESSLCPLCRAKVVRAGSSAEGAGVGIPLSVKEAAEALQAVRTRIRGSQAYRDIKRAGAEIKRASSAFLQSFSEAMSDEQSTTGVCRCGACGMAVRYPDGVHQFQCPGCDAVLQAPAVGNR
jgi:hypothetical protein